MPRRTNLMLAVAYRCNYSSYDIERSALGAIGADFQHVEALDDVTDPDKVVALFVRQEEVDQAVLARYPQLKVIQRYGVGTDNVDLVAARARNIHVCNTPDYGQEHEVSDHAVALYLALSRRLLSRDGDVRGGAWDIGQTEPIPGHRGASLGLVGFGRIARCAATKFRALGFKTIHVVDPALSPEEAGAADVILTDLDHLCASADVLSLHAPLLEATHHMIGKEQLALMKPSAFLINVSRGGLVDEVALAQALKDGRLAGAGVDVYEQEPPDRQAALFSAPNTILTDHMAWYSEAAVQNLQSEATGEVVRVLKNEPPLYKVN